MWPLYHDVIAPPEFHRTWWDAYRRVNRRFADAVIRHAAEGATVWVQDYQLQLVPKMLREARPDLKIGFFNHIPFPPPEIFAQLPWRRAIIDGLLGADLVGFQRSSDAGNFMRSARRFLGASVKQQQVHVKGTDGETTHIARAQAFPISIDVKQISELAQQPGGHRARRSRSGGTSATPRPSCSASTGSTTPRASGTGSRPTRNSCRTASSPWRTRP